MPEADGKPKDNRNVVDNFARDTLQKVDVGRGIADGIAELAEILKVDNPLKSEESSDPKPSGS